MSVFSDLMTETVVPALTAVFGDAATYTVESTVDGSFSSVSTQAIVTRDVDASEWTGFSETLTVVDLPHADVASPAIGATVAVGSETFTIRQIVADDGYFVRAIVR